MYLLYVVAIIGCVVLLLRRSRERHTWIFLPQTLEIALLRGGMGAVVETVIFDLKERKIIELAPDGSSRRLLVQITPAHKNNLSPLEDASVSAFVAVQGNLRKLQGTRRQLAESLKSMEENMKNAGWWKTPARWHWILTLMVPCLIAGGSLRFMDDYEGIEKWVLVLTVPLLAVFGRRMVLRELSGPTKGGKELLAKLRMECAYEAAPLSQVALFGTQHLAGNPDQRLFCIMTRGIPYGYL